eukprot:4726359-Lingulodinium_polyedra.AAC.1
MHQLLTGPHHRLPRRARAQAWRAVRPGDQTARGSRGQAWGLLDAREPRWLSSVEALPDRSAPSTHQRLGGPARHVRLRGSLPQANARD